MLHSSVQKPYSKTENPLNKIKSDCHWFSARYLEKKNFLFDYREHKTNNKHAQINNLILFWAWDFKKQILAFSVHNESTRQPIEKRTNLTHTWIIYSPSSTFDVLFSACVFEITLHPIHGSLCVGLDHSVFFFSFSILHYCYRSLSAASGPWIFRYCSFFSTH